MLLSVVALMTLRFHWQALKKNGLPLLVLIVILKSLCFHKLPIRENMDSIRDGYILTVRA